MLRMFLLCFPKDRVQKQHFGIGFTLFFSGPLTKTISQTMIFNGFPLFSEGPLQKCRCRILFLCFPKDRVQKQDF